MMSGQEITDKRLDELETRLAHFERMGDDLSSVIADQGRTIDILTRQVRHLLERLSVVEAGGGGAIADDKPPPHY